MHTGRRTCAVLINGVDRGGCFDALFACSYVFKRKKKTTTKTTNSIICSHLYLIETTKVCAPLPVTCTCMHMYKHTRIYMYVFIAHLHAFYFENFPLTRAISRFVVT